MITLMFVAAFLATPTSTDDFARYQPMLESVRADDVVLPIASCARAKIAAYNPSATEVGDLKKAAALLGTSLEACGFESGSNKLKASLKAKNPQLSPTEIERASQHAFAIPVVLLLGQATEQLKVAPSAQAPVPPISIPCTSAQTKDSKHPCFEKK